MEAITRKALGLRCSKTAGMIRSMFKLCLPWVRIGPRWRVCSASTATHINPMRSNVKSSSVLLAELISSWN